MDSLRKTTQQRIDMSLYFKLQALQHEWFKNDGILLANFTDVVEHLFNQYRLLKSREDDNGRVK